MRIESSVTAISWIPSDAIEEMPKLPFELGVARYDAPPPEHVEEGDLERLRREDRFREANRLAAWIDVEDGRVVRRRERRHHVAAVRRLNDRFRRIPDLSAAAPAEETLDDLDDVVGGDGQALQRALGEVQETLARFHVVVLASPRRAQLAS